MSAARAARPGRRVRGERAQMLVRVPIDHHNLYERKAEELGIPLGSWVTMQLAELYDLPIPEYIHEELATAEQRRRADESRQELPMPRTA